jgi:hypothetical protein
MSSLWNAVFIQVLDGTGPLMLNLSGTPYINFRQIKAIRWAKTIMVFVLNAGMVFRLILLLLRDIAW